MIKRKCTYCQITPLKAPMTNTKDRSAYHHHTKAHNICSTPTPGRLPKCSITETNTEKNLANPCRYPDKHLQRSPSAEKRKSFYVNLVVYLFFHRPCEDAVPCITHMQCQPKHRCQYMQCALKIKPSSGDGNTRTKVSISSCRAVRRLKEFR